jgi:hypothetical protein
MNCIEKGMFEKGMDELDCHKVASISQFDNLGNYIVRARVELSAIGKCQGKMPEPSADTFGFEKATCFLQVGTIRTTQMSTVMGRENSNLHFSCNGGKKTSTCITRRSHKLIVNADGKSVIALPVQ